MRYSVEDIAKLFFKLETTSYPPSGKCYEFRLPNGKLTTCENWNLKVRIVELLKIYGGENEED